MNTEIHFFVEDITHQKFLQHYIEHLYGIKIDDSNFTKTDSWGGIKLKKNKIKELIDEQTKLLIFIDSDIEYAKRFKEIEIMLSNIEKDISQTFVRDLFLFPNNKNVGNVETLLGQIATKQEIINCFEKYESCISTFNLPDKKSKIYAYLEALDSKNIKEDKRNYLNKDHWDLTHVSLEPLKEFLTPFFSKT